MHMFVNSYLGKQNLTGLQFTSYQPSQLSLTSYKPSQSTGLHDIKPGSEQAYISYQPSQPVSQ